MYTITMKTLLLNLVVAFICIAFRCVPTENTPDNPFTTTPDTSQQIVPPAADPEPIITIGDGTAESITATALATAVDSLANRRCGGTIRFSGGAVPITLRLTTPLMISAPDTPFVIDGGNRVTLDGGESNRLVVCANHAHLILKNIRLVNGSADSSGGALLHPWFGSLACYNVVFFNNRCTTKGPEFGGGAIFSGGLEHALLYRCNFTGNIGSNGGAILNRGTNLTIDSCIFTRNAASGDGGGKDAGPLGQGGLGGAVYIDGMNSDSAEIFVLKNSSFTHNISHGHGSAVFSYEYKNRPGQHGAIVDGCSFYDNSDSGVATTSTGTLYHEGSPLRLTACTFAGNTTLEHAGALFLGVDATTEIINCTFYRNRTPGNGGAVFGGRQNIRIVNCTFVENEGSYGPAIFNDVPEAVAIYNTLFVNNVPIVNQYAYRNCTATYTTGSAVYQWPAAKANGNPDNSCVAGALFTNPLLDTLKMNGGRVETMALRDGSPVLGVCSDCPSADGRGMPRTDRCDAGAFEVP